MFSSVLLALVCSQTHVLPIRYYDVVVMHLEFFIVQCALFSFVVCNRPIGYT